MATPGYGGVARRWLLVAVLVALSGGLALAADTPPQLNWQGSWQPGGLLVADLPVGYQLHWQGTPLAVDSQQRLLFGLPRDATDTVTFTLVRSADGREWPLRHPLTPRSYPVQRVDGVPQQTVTPPPEQLRRIRREAALVAAARSASLTEPLYASGFRAPAQGPITGVYGSQRIYNGTPGRPHYGVDYAAPEGTAVVAPAAGVVVLAEPDLFYSGGTVIVDHGYGLNSSFLHMSALAVAVGDRLEAGAAIGEVGASGRATGPHLDWRMNWGAVRIDPQLVLQALPALANQSSISR
jgi:murein DD-endopeptidase MepM/ murein hydrolase activator NlpD